MHEFRAGALLLQKALAGVPGIKVDVYDMGWPHKMVDGARVDDSGALDTADAVLIYADGGKGNPAIQGERMKVIDALAARGAGLGFGHYGVEVPAGVPGEAFQRWIGGYYETELVGEPDVEAGVRQVPEPPGDPRRRTVRHARRVVLQHALGARRRAQGTPDAAARRQADRRGAQGTLRQPERARTTTSSRPAAATRR